MYIKDKDTLTMDFVIKQILQENVHKDVSHVTLMREGKEKKPVKQSQDPSINSNAKKKNIKYYYCKKKEYFKSECKKLKADQAAGTVPKNKRVERSKTQTTKVATISKEENIVCIFMAWRSTSDLAGKWIINLEAISLIVRLQPRRLKSTPSVKTLDLIVEYVFQPKAYI